MLNLLYTLWCLVIVVFMSSQSAYYCRFYQALAVSYVEMSLSSLELFGDSYSARRFAGKAAELMRTARSHARLAIPWNLLRYAFKSVRSTVRF